MPAPPQMPADGAPPSAWGSPPPPPPPATQDPSRAGGDGVSGIAGSEAAPVSADAPAADSAADESMAPHQAAAIDEPAAADLPAPAPKAAVAPVVQSDWLATVCPYLTSEDGTYRAATPDEGHRCTAQDPAATLPLAFQERFCLTDRHPRCEMYKFAQETDASGGIPEASVPPTDPPTPTTRPAGGGRPNGPVLATLAGIAGLVIVVLLVVVMGSCAGDGEPADDPDLATDEQATEAPASTQEPTPAPTPDPEDPSTPEPEADATPDAAAGEIDLILYEIQPDEALRRISETFGITRNRIRRENPELENVANSDLPGIIIEIPIVGDMTLAEAQALPGYVGPAGDAEPEPEA